VKRPIQSPIFFAILLSVAFVQPASPQTQPQFALTASSRVQAVADHAAQVALEKFAASKLQTNELAITLVDLRDPQKPERGSFRGGEQVYPASVVKLFYLAAAHQWIEEGKLQDSEELRRAMRDMVVESLNEATGLVVDSLTGTTSGPELAPAELETWYAKRNAVNRWLTSLGYTNINVNRKPWCEGPYGREMQSVKRHQPNHRNWLTTDATARLLAEIAAGRAVTPERSRQMMELLHRRPFDKKAERQSLDYTAPALPEGSKLWSKAGWTSETRHDAAYVELPNGAKFVLVVFTVNHSNEKDIIPAVARVIIEAMR
jgi:beta-lactamase class A